MSKNRITPIGTKRNGMTLLKYSSFADQASELRLTFLVQCDCGHKFRMINRNFLRCTTNRCPECIERNNPRK